MNNILGLIPARAGSKGVRHKNIRLLSGRPLLQYTIRTAQESRVIDRLILSTDSDRIAEIGQAAGVEVPFLRPANLASDETPMLDVVAHAIEQLEALQWYPKIILILQPTSPLRKTQHIRAAIDMINTQDCDSVVSVVQVLPHLSPDYVMRLDHGRLIPFLNNSAGITRRQDVRPAYYRDGTIYAVKRSTVMEMGSLYGEVCLPLLIPPSDSLSIDTEEDWRQAEKQILNSNEQ
jgi:CMP-N,N'-diacetyllegionaminic acid synthase